MKETPLLFTPENAQKVHDGSKAMTRRLNGLAAVNASPDDWEYGGVNVHGRHIFYHKTDETEDGCLKLLTCPYGTVGDRLWVREAFQLWREGWDRTGHVIYKGGRCDREGRTFEADEIGKWTPAIHMHKKYCRTWLELTGVRVERVREITDADCEAEGVRPSSEGDGTDWRDDENGWHRTYRQLWDSINGNGSWDLNSWVWVLEYRKVTR